MSQRTKPYTAAGIKRCKCFRCGKRASQQWTICADNNSYRPVCIECDIELNRVVLTFMGFSNVDELISNYIKKLEDKFLCR